LTYTSNVKGGVGGRYTVGCETLQPVAITLGKSIAYTDFECSVKLNQISGAATLGFKVNADAGPSVIVAETFVIRPVETTTTETDWATLTQYTTLNPEPAATTTLYQASATITSTAYVEPTPSATATSSDYLTTETAWETLTPAPWGTHTM
jgi:hypothetical protein